MWPSCQHWFRPRRSRNVACSSRITRCYGLPWHCNIWPSYNSQYGPTTKSTPPRLLSNRDIDLPTTTDTSFLRWPSSCILRLIRPQLSATIIQLHSTTQPTSAFSYDHPAAFYHSTDLSFQLRSSSCILPLNRPQLPAMIVPASLQRFD